MILSNNELAGYIKNSINCKEEEGYITFLRFTDRQMQLYADNPMFRAMSYCSSGICMTFDTTGNTITFECKSEGIIKAIKPDDSAEQTEEIPRTIILKAIGQYARYMLEAGVLPDTKQHFDLYVNGSYIKSVRFKNGKIVFKFDNDHGEWVNIKIWFPLCAQVSIRNFTCNGEHRPSLKKAAGIMYSLGDSITQGFMVSKPSFGYIQALSMLLGLDALNQGISGYFYNPEILNGFEDMPVPNLITVAYGTNDWGLGHSYSEIERNVKGFYARLHDLYPTVRVNVITPIWRKDMDKKMESGTLKDIIALIEKTAGQYNNIRVIDGLAISPHCPKLYEDGFLHPGAAGNMYMTPRIFKAMVDGES